MSLGRIGSTSSAVGISSATAVGIDEVTNASAEVEFKTMVQAKDGQGQLKAMLLGKKVATLSTQGYTTTFEPPVLGGAIVVGGISGKIVSSSLRATVEDFAKVTATGKALEAL